MTELKPSTPLTTVPAPEANDAIRVRDLHMSYGTHHVLSGVDFHAAKGEVIALLGPNGAGKTTTIEILEGFRKRSSGDVQVLGQDPNRAGEAWRAKLGIVLQTWRDHGRWVVRDLIQHIGSLYSSYSDEKTIRPWNTEELLEAVGLTEQAKQRVNNLSGGQRRRLDVALGIVGKPELLFLDEPTVGFDPHARYEFHELVHRIADIDGTTILLTTHDLAEAEKLADRILILAGGHVIADGSAEELNQRMSTESEVKWTIDGELFVHATLDPTSYVRGLFDQYGDKVDNLEVRRASLEETYMNLVQQFETGQATTALAEFKESFDE